MYKFPFYQSSPFVEYRTEKLHERIIKRLQEFADTEKQPNMARTLPKEWPIAVEAKKCQSVNTKEHLKYIFWGPVVTVPIEFWNYSLVFQNTPSREERTFWNGFCLGYWSAPRS